MSHCPYDWIQHTSIHIALSLLCASDAESSFGSDDATVQSLVSMMLRCMIVNTVRLVDLLEMHKTDCFGQIGLVLHIPSSS